MITKTKIRYIIFGIILVSMAGNNIFACSIPPTAVINCEYPVKPYNQSFTLTGSGVDSDGIPITVADYDWTFPAGATNIGGQGTGYVGCRFPTPGKYTISLRVKDQAGIWSQNTNFIVTSVNIDKIQYWDSGTSDYVDISGTLYVNKGTSITFKAIPNPFETIWPSGKPVWGGTAGATGICETKSVAFDAVSSSTSDYKTVTAECGDTETVYVIVYELEGLFCPAEDFQGRSVSKYGVEEVVELDWDSTPSGVTASQIGSLQWGLVNGPGTLTGVTSGGQAWYDAGPTPGHPWFVLMITSGPSDNRGILCNDKEVVKPDAYMIQVPNTCLWHDEDSATIGFLGYHYLTPKEVSFANIEFKEGECEGIGTGYFTVIDNLVHPASVVWGEVGTGNIDTGCRVLGFDTVQIGPCPNPYSTGQFTWPIPYLYRGDGGNAISFTTANQIFKINADGDLAVEKKGAGPFEAEFDDPESNYDCN